MRVDAPGSISLIAAQFLCFPPTRLYAIAHSEPLNGTPKKTALEVVDLKRRRKISAYFSHNTRAMAHPY